jgi:hypothetical protein
MPYISIEKVKIIRNLIKSKYPKFKFSIRNDNHSSVYISILSGPIQMLTTSQNPGKGYEQVNKYYISEHYEKFPEVRDILLDIYNIANRNNGTEVIDGDYGLIPCFYVNISIGQWDKPYIVTT